LTPADPQWGLLDVVVFAAIVALVVYFEVGSFVAWSAQ
jgi:hypothetical protein